MAAQDYIKIALLYFLLLFVQVNVLNHLDFDVPFMALVHPMVVFYVIIIMPRMNEAAYLALAFCTGFFMDSFYHTQGLHSFGFVLIAFIRQPLLNYLKLNEEQRETALPHISFLGLRRFVIYSLLMSLTYHIFTVMLAVFSFQAFQSSLSRIFMSTLLSVFFFVVLDIIFFRKSQNAQ